MSERSFQVIFGGDLALDTDEDQVRQSLAEQCKYSTEAINKILSGKNPVLKEGLNQSTARRYKDFLDRLGLLCNIIAEPAPKSLSNPHKNQPSLEIRQDLIPETVGRSCPKCLAKEQTGDSCTRCGLLFSRFEEIQKRRAENPRPQPEASIEKSYFELHPEQLFILKAFAVIIAILLLRNLLSGFLFIIFLIFPIGFLVYIRLQAAMNDQSATELLAQHITFMPVMYSKEERAQEYIPRVTYSLILVNVLIFYLFELQVNPQMIFDQLVFLPYKPNLFNVPLSAFTSLFLHASHAHLWGNMLFLWAVGTVVERRIGAKRFILFYFAAGISADISYMLACAIIGIPAHLLGASGAIAGVMGIFAMRCYFKSMVFPLPILGVFSLFLPISLKIRLNSLVIIGLFFLADLSGGVQQLTGTSSSNVGHWAHIGGMLCGIALAISVKLNEEAITERHMDIGSQAVTANLGTGTSEGEESLRMVLKQDPQNVEALLLLARLRTKYSTTEEGEELYRQVIPLLARSRPDDALIA
ncbi:MAG: rhomboid family intramembrane serine protease, partial [Geopsychrobacter sp.]|nr:rhomboid family intramembrane serine protease [Geopsychrobacter sp.]